MINNDTPFRPVLGTEESIHAQSSMTGKLFFATDTGKIYLGVAPDECIPVGGAGASVLYASAENPAQDPVEDAIYLLYIDDLDDAAAKPQKGDLIINSDGTFYKVDDIGTEFLRCIKVAVSGSGTGGGGGSTATTFTRGSLTVTNLGESNILNGGVCKFNILALSALEDGVAVDPDEDAMKVTITYTEDGSTVPYYTDIKTVTHNEPIEYEATNFLHPSVTINIKFTVTGSDSNIFRSGGTVTRSITTTNLSLEWLESSFSNNSYFDGLTRPVTVVVSASTAATRIYDLYFDDYLVSTQVLDQNSSPANVTINAKTHIYNLDGSDTGNTLEDVFTHGTHVVSAKLSLATSKKQRGSSTDMISKEIALFLEQKPLIWVGEMNSTYYEFDTIFVPLRVYDPAAINNQDGMAHVYVYKDGRDLLDGEYLTINNDASDWKYYEISELSVNQNPTYTFRIGQGDTKVEKNLTFTVLEDKRNMHAAEDAIFSFAAKGYSNTMSKKARENVSFGAKKAKFTNFNWYNNGWVTENKQTSLRISNGAKFELPIGPMTFGATFPHSIEFRMKISNVQDYSTLVTNYTLYKAENAAGKKWNDGDYNATSNPEGSGLFTQFLAQRSTGFKSYDAYLAKQLPIEQAKNKAAYVPNYDDLEYRGLYKDYNLNNAAITYMASGANISQAPAICFGPQDGFFSNGTNAVSANFVENQIINVSIICSGGTTMSGEDNLMKIYINGMLTSISRSTKSKEGTSNSSWTIGDDNTSFIFNSATCDIDLYNFRVYNKALDVCEVLYGYAYDNTDTEQWDLINDLQEVVNNQYQFSYNKMIDYNNQSDVKLGKKQAIMPYIVFTTDDSLESLGNLPWYKTESDATGVSHYERVDMEFVNPALDIAFNRGLLAGAAKNEKYEDDVDENGNVKLSAVQKYYLHHCPSWIAKDIDLGVQGTSSEFYPRRNYKAKTQVKNQNGETKIHYLGDNQDIYYTEYKTDKIAQMTPHRGPFATEYEKYVTDETGEVARRKMDYFYYDNDTVGTNKFTLKIDFMESSGSYNMGLANLVKNAYSNHPLSNYLSAGAFVKPDAGKYQIATSYTAGTKYWYVTHKGAIKAADGSAEASVNITNADDFAKSPIQLWVDNGGSKTKPKILLNDAAATAAGVTNVTTFEAGENQIKAEEIDTYIGKWLIELSAPGMKPIKPADVALNDYRTSVQGFPTLAFHQTKTMKEKKQEPVFIGRYNMLLDKGADDAYGFKLGGKQAFVDNKDIEEVAECWEFENNNRGYCSFRDPWNRRELSFAPPEGESETSMYTTNGAPIVADSFEYRYHVDSDYIDLLTHLNNAVEQNKDRIQLFEQYGIDVGAEGGKDIGRKKLLELYGNWEKAVAWVWSTATDATIKIGDTLTEVPSLGRYEEIELNDAYVENKYYTKHYEDIKDGDNVIGFEEVYTISKAYDPEETYYKKTTVGKDDIYSVIKVSTNPDEIYVKNTYYTLINHNYVLSEDPFDQLTTYYKLIKDLDSLGEEWKLTDEQLAEAASWNEVDGVPTYTYDTKEFRLAKFKNELGRHFNFEYLVTYFIVTEVLECYDSRGKNCMMASWGPQQAGGDYIWYPIFYDLDTQLGINNTGIPSFDYDIDATEDGSFSTNDSVLWNNLYSVFKNSISLKYQQLKGTAVAAYTGFNTNANGTLNNPPFYSVDKIEQFYSCDPTVYNSYSMQGRRPLLALNLDEQYKYIAITNTNMANTYKQIGEDKVAIPPVRAGYVGSNIGAPLWETDSEDTYFYALQGNRAMSRQQFLTNRFNYIDSWLNVGNYARAGKNRIRSRISANSSLNTSDKWIQGTAQNGDLGLITNSDYFKEDGITKNHMFDGEYWITMTPARNMYVTVGTDAANFPSVKYSGTPVKFETSDLKNGVLYSGNYREQLYYIYGLNQMKSLGDLSKLYFQEFALEGQISKLTDLKLGYDGLDENNQPYKNSGVNDWTIPGSANNSDGGMPLMKEVNLCNIIFKNTTKTVNLTSCTKLENFRCTGSNITGVDFAEGVALNTLYLSDTITYLNLTEARLLTNIITEYETPTLDENTGNLVAKPGLYVAKLTDFKPGDGATAITSLIINGGSLGYNSYSLLEKYYTSCMLGDGTLKRKISMTGVQWSPYVLIEDENLAYDSGKTYWVDNGHFGLRQFNAAKGDSWVDLIKNKMVYEYDADIAANMIQITNADLFLNLVKESRYIGIAGNDSNPNLTGIVFINNTTALDEGYIQNALQIKYPGMTFFFGQVKKGFAARFIIKDEATGVETLLGTDKVGLDELKDGSKVFFTNPTLRTEENFDYGTIDAANPTKDLLGWSTTNNSSGLVETYDTNWVDALGHTPVHTWNAQTLQVTYDEDGNPIDSATTFDYTYYAVLSDKYWEVKFYLVGDDGETLTEIPGASYSIVHNSVLRDPNILVSRSEAILNERHGFEPQSARRYKFLGYSQRANNTMVATGAAYLAFDFSKNVKVTSNMSFYAMFMEESVLASATNTDYFKFTPTTYAKPNYDTDFSASGCIVEPADGKTLSGKITIPTVDPVSKLPVIKIGSGFSHQPNIEAIYWQGDSKLLEVCDGAFQADGAVPKLTYFDLPSTVRYLGNSAFKSCENLAGFPNISICNNLKYIGNSCFNQCGSRTNHVVVPVLTIPASVVHMETSAIQYIRFEVTVLNIGTATDGSALSYIGQDFFRQNSGWRPTTVNIYTKLITADNVGNYFYMPSETSFSYLV